MAKHEAIQEVGEKVWHCPVHGDFPNRFRWSAHRRYCHVGRGSKRPKRRGPGRPPKVDPEKIERIMEKLRWIPGTKSASKPKRIASCLALNEAISVGVKKAELVLRSGENIHPVMDVYYATLPEAVKFIKDALKREAR